MASGKQRRPGGGPAKSTRSTKSARSTKAAGPTKAALRAGSSAGGAARGAGAGAASKAATGARARAGGGASRAERLEAARRERRRRAVWMRLGIAGAALTVVGAGLFAASRPDSVVSRLESGPGGCRYDTDFDGTARTQSDHVDNPSFEVDPPAGGAHEPTAAAAGFYTTDDVPSDGKLVHAMEHGFVVLWHRPDISAGTREEIEGLSDRFGRELIVVPRPSLEGEVAVTAWHRRLLCRRLDAEVVALFTDTYRDQGPEKGFL